MSRSVCKLKGSRKRNMQSVGGKDQKRVLSNQKTVSSYRAEHHISFLSSKRSSSRSTGNWLSFLADEKDCTSNKQSQQSHTPCDLIRNLVRRSCGYGSMKITSEYLICLIMANQDGRCSLLFTSQIDVCVNLWRSPWISKDVADISSSIL